MAQMSFSLSGSFCPTAQRSTPFGVTPGCRNLAARATNAIVTSAVAAAKPTRSQATREKLTRCVRFHRTTPRSNRKSCWPVTRRNSRSCFATTPTLVRPCASAEPAETALPRPTTRRHLPARVLLATSRSSGRGDLNTTSYSPRARGLTVSGLRRVCAPQIPARAE